MKYTRTRRAPGVYSRKELMTVIDGYQKTIEIMIRETTFKKRERSYEGQYGARAERPT